MKDKVVECVCGAVGVRTQGRVSCGQFLGYVYWVRGHRQKGERGCILHVARTYSNPGEEWLQDYKGADRDNVLLLALL